MSVQISLFLLPALCVSGLTRPPESLYVLSESDSYSDSEFDSEFDSDIDSDDDISVDTSAPPRCNAEVEVKKESPRFCRKRKDSAVC